MAEPGLSQVRLVRGVVCQRLVLPATRPPLATPMVHCLLRGETGTTRVETQTQRHVLPAQAWSLVPRGQACALHGTQAVAWAVWFAPAEVPTGGIDGDLVEALVHRAFLGATPLTVTPTTDAAALALLRTMADETGAGRPGALDCCRALLQHLLVLLARDARLRAETRRTRPLAAGRERLEAALALIEARFAEPLTVADLAALIAGASLVLTNNTATMHLADACRIPQVVLYSGTDLEEQWAPRDGPARLLRRPTACHPCYRFTCPHNLECLDIEPEEVTACALDMLCNPTTPKPSLIVEA